MNSKINITIEIDINKAEFLSFRILGFISNLVKSSSFYHPFGKNV